MLPGYTVFIATHAAMVLRNFYSPGDMETMLDPVHGSLHFHLGMYMVDVLLLRCFARHSSDSLQVRIYPLPPLPLPPRAWKRVHPGCCASRCVLPSLHAHRLAAA